MDRTHTATIRDNAAMLPRGVASAHRPPPTLRTSRSLQPGLRDHSSETNAVGRPSGMECEESKPQECLLSPASKAHLSVFSGMGFCLREEASLLQPKLGTSETGWKTASPASSGCPHHTHCPPWTTTPPPPRETHRAWPPAEWREPETGWGRTCSSEGPN